MNLRRGGQVTGGRWRSRRPVGRCGVLRPGAYGASPLLARVVTPAGKISALYVHPKGAPSTPDRVSAHSLMADRAFVGAWVLFYACYKQESENEGSFERGCFEEGDGWEEFFTMTGVASLGDRRGSSGYSPRRGQKNGHMLRELSIENGYFGRRLVQGVPWSPATSTRQIDACPVDAWVSCGDRRRGDGIGPTSYSALPHFLRSVTSTESVNKYLKSLSFQKA